MANTQCWAKSRGNTDNVGKHHEEYKKGKWDAHKFQNRVNERHTTKVGF